MKKGLLAAALLLFAATMVSAQGNTEASSASTDSTAPKTYKVGISKLLPHPALDAVEKGAQDYLATTDLQITYDVQNANGDISTVNSIAQKFKDDKDDVVLGIATPSAQALANTFDTTPVVYAAVTDPVGAGLTAKNIAGVSDMNQVEDQMKLFVQIDPNVKTIGNVYTSSEANGVVQMEQAKAAAEKLGLGFVEVAVNNTSEVKMAAQSIIDRVDGVFVSTDNNVVSALASIDEVCTKAGKPFFACDPSSVSGTNFLVAWGCDYYKIGLKTGKTIEALIKGTDPKSIGDNGNQYMTEPDEIELWINLDEAKALGLTIDQELLDSASVIIENGEQKTKN